MKSLLITGASFLIAVSHSSGAVLYSNQFDNGVVNSTLSTNEISTVGWNALRGNATTTAVVPVSSGTYPAGYGAGPNPTHTPTLNDYIYVQKTMSAEVDMDFILRTNDTAPSNPFVGLTPFAPSSFTSLTAIWTRNGGNNVAGHRFMIQSAGSWYVSTVNYTEFGAGQSSAAALDLLTTGWTNLDLSGGFLAIGSTASTYSDLFGAGQTITGIGFYVDNLSVPGSGASSFRLDNIVIEGIPETSSAALGMVGLTALLLRRRK